MSPDRRSVDEILAEIEQRDRRPAAPRTGSTYGSHTGGSVVAYTSPPLTWGQVIKFLLSVTVLVALGVGGWRYGRVSFQIFKLKSSDEKVRQKAAAELGVYGSSRAVDPLVAALNDTQPDVQVSAAKALGQIKDQRAFDPLLAAFHGGRTNYEVENAEAEALGGLGTAALDPLLADLKDKDLGSAAGNGLVQLGAPAVDSLIALLKDRNPDIRAQVAECLGEIKDGRADQPLIAALKDKDERVPQAAAKALGEIGDPEAANFLFAALHKHNTEIVAAARDFFIKRGEPGTEDALIDALDKSGDEGMAAEFLNSGNQKLADAAHAWAGRNNYEITYMPGSGSTGWGSK